MKKKRQRKKNKEVTLSDIVENEIKFNGLRQGFSKALNKFSKNLKYKSSIQHSDLTNIPFVTIDGEDSKDFDDAVWSECNKKKTKIMIAIADVSFYVEKGDLIDTEAKKRGNSFYFPNKVIPMLPEELSNDLCSLVPKKKRKSVVLEIDLDDGKIKKFKFYRAVVKSIARLTYQEAENIFLEKNKNNKLFSIVLNLFNTFKVLQENSKKRNKISFDPDEYIIQTNNEKNINLIKKKKLESYKLIEEFMVLANTIVGHYLKSNNIKSVFRNHEKPPSEKTRILKEIISQYNLNHSGLFNSQHDFNKIIEILKENKISFLNDILLRSQSRAFYGTENKGHFGLSLDYYVHFTSPIRRYSDLVVHRDLIDSYFFKKKNSRVEFIDHLNTQEKKADSIERTIFDVASSYHLKKFRNYEFKGFIDSVENFGIFIKAINFPFSGLARYNKTFSSKYEEKHENQYKLGQIVKFKIKKINNRNGKILLFKVKKLGDDAKK